MDMPIANLTSFSPLDFRVAFEEIRQQETERWRSERCKEALGQRIARAAERVDAGRCTCTLGTSENACCKESAGIGLGKDTLGKVDARAAEDGAGPSPQTAWQVEAKTVIDQRRSAAGRPETHFVPLNTDTLFFGKTLHASAEFSSLGVYARLSVRR